jgi:hypothetical protein
MDFPACGANVISAFALDKNRRHELIKNLIKFRIQSQGKSGETLPSPDARGFTPAPMATERKITPGGGR